MNSAIYTGSFLELEAFSFSRPELTPEEKKAGARIRKAWRNFAPQARAARTIQGAWARRQFYRKHGRREGDRTYHVDLLDPSSLSHTLQAAARAALQTAVSDEVSDTVATAMALEVCEETRLFLRAQLLASYARTEEERPQAAKSEEVVESAALSSANSSSSLNSTDTGTTSGVPPSLPAEPRPRKTSSAPCAISTSLIYMIRACS